MRFFYGVTLDRAEIPERIGFARTPRKLPVILSADEVIRFLEVVPSLNARAALTAAYAAGLRASEAVSLKVADIDSARMLIPVHHGKGAKDRTVMLSPQLLTILRTYWRLARPGEWLFPGRKLVHRAREKPVALAKKVGLDLRQSYTRVGKLALIEHQRYAHAKQFKRAGKALRKLKSYLGRTIRGIGRQVAGDDGLRAPEVECIGKGKPHRPYEFGVKVSVATTLHRS